MEIVAYQPELATDMHNLYNQTIAPVAHCYPIDLKRFTEALEPTLKTHNKGPKNMRSQKAFVAIEQNTVLGYVQAGLLVDSEEHIQCAGIRFLSYKPGHRSVGDALIKKIESWSRNAGATTLFAFHQQHRLPFYHYAGSHLSDRMGHIQASFAMRQFEKFAGAVFLTHDNFRPREPQPNDFTMTTKVAQKYEGNTHLPNLIHEALINNKVVGTCISISSEVDLKHNDVKDFLFVDELDVEEQWQGKGIGKYLLQSVLNSAYDIGYRQAGISTTWDNHRAFIFYSNFGFAVSDWTYGWKKEL